MVMLADGSHKHVIVRGSADSHYGNPSCSPDGTRIAYTRFVLGPDGNPAEPFEANIFTAWVTGHNPKQITSGAEDNKADWGPAIRKATGCLTALAGEAHAAAIRSSAPRG